MTALSSSRHRLLFHVRHLSTAVGSSSPPITASRVKSLLRSEHDPDKALAIFSSANNLSPVSSRYALDLTVRRLAKSRRFADIETLVESQKSDPKIAQEPFLSHLILTYGSAGMLDPAIKTFEQMDSLGTPRSAVSFNALLTACNLSKKYDQVPRLFSELSKSYQISPDKISYGILIKSLCESGLPESAFPILKEMEEKNIEITTITYTSILDAFYKKGKIEDAEKIWNEMREKGCQLDVATYNVKIMRTAHHGMPRQVQGLMNEMVSLGLKPDTISYNYLMTCYFKNEKVDEAKKVYEGLKEKGCLPNMTTFRTLVYYLCQNRDFDAALEFYKVSMRRNQIPDFWTSKCLVKGLAKKSNMEVAKELIGELKNRFPDSSLKWDKVEKEIELKAKSKGSAQAVAIS